MQCDDDTTQRTKELLTEMRVLGQLERGDKLCTESAMFYIEAAGSLQGVRRLYNGESRIRNIQRIENSVHGLLCCLRRILVDKQSVPPVSDSCSSSASLEVRFEHIEHRQLLAETVRVLRGAIRGLRNLCYSYAADACVSAQLESLISSISGILEIDELGEV